MYKTQLIQRDEAPDFAQADYTGITGDATEPYIRRAVQWTLTEAWEEGEIDAQFDVPHVAVAVWRGDVFLGVYAMDAVEVCPEWRNLKRVEETPGAA